MALAMPLFAGALRVSVPAAAGGFAAHPSASALACPPAAAGQVGRAGRGHCADHDGKKRGGLRWKKLTPSGPTVRGPTRGLPFPLLVPVDDGGSPQKKKRKIISRDNWWRKNMLNFHTFPPGQCYKILMDFRFAQTSILLDYKCLNRSQCVAVNVHKCPESFVCIQRPFYIQMCVHRGYWQKLKQNRIFIALNRAS
jgi:hypothetical protein